MLCCENPVTGLQAATRYVLCVSESIVLTGTGTRSLVLDRLEARATDWDTVVRLGRVGATARHVVHVPRLGC
jgi:hypothetical protein